MNKLALFLAVSLSVAAFQGVVEAQSLPINPAFTGSWYNPSANGEGFNIEIGPNGFAAIYAYTYNVETSMPDWHICQGGYGFNEQFGGDVIVAPCYINTSGGRPGSGSYDQKNPVVATNIVYVVAFSSWVVLNCE